MDTKILISLINNAALLLAMCIVYDALSINRETLKQTSRQMLSGIILGTICIAVMLNPLPWHQGIIFDTRSVLLCVAGFFFEPLSAAIAVCMAITYRLLLGGSGVYMGIAVIISSAGLAMLWKILRKSDPANMTLHELYLLGLTVHLVMLGFMALLPSHLVFETIISIGLPVLIVYPIATALLGKMMVGRHAQKRTEAALKESEQNYREIFNATSEAIIIEEVPIGRMLDVNASMLEMYGYDSKEEVLRCNLGDLSANIPPYTTEEARQCIRLAIEEGPQVFEWLAKKKSGDFFWAEISMRSSSIGGHGRVLAVVRDISERKRTQETLRQSEERWQYALEGSGDGVWDREIQTNKVFYSDQWKRMLGYEPDEISHTPTAWKQLIHPEDLEKVMQELRRHERDETPEYLAEYRIRCKDGSYKWILARGKVMIRDAHGNALRIVGTHTDITERKQLEEQLRQAQKMEAVGQLAGGVAHDFNNILTTIIGRTYLLQSRLRGQEDLLAHVEQVALAAERATTLTQSLLSFSREQVMDQRRISLNETVHKASDIFSRLIREDIEITMRLSDKNPIVFGDESQLIQVLMNLATNARDAITGTGRILITTDIVTFDRHTPMAVGGTMPPGAYATLTVTDTGYGMDAATQTRIFEPFFTTKEVGKGTGLGLSVVYGIIRRHSGFLRLQSESGNGTTFSVHLSALVTDNSEVRNKQDELSLPKGRGTILLAEDENAVRLMLQTILSENGYRVIEATNGVEAVLRFSENLYTIDAVLLDVIMPRMNGREARKEILKIRNDVKVIFMSGYSGDIIKEETLREEGVGFIHKPLNPRDVLLQLHEILATPHGAETPCRE
ncbi:MAG TPA: PAS domain S-box protein [Geobacteraceae bacterium]|nr:PAS domain S-box protein [Geobacteraceae bacterium]